MLIILRRTYCSQASQIIRKQLKGRHADIFNPLITPFREAWIHNFDSLHSVKLGLIQLHPQIFASFPRTDIINENIKWQKKYRQVDWLSMPTSAEFKTGNKKPWPQKGTGRARHGSTRAPQWHYGGWVHGPRGPTTFFYLLPFYIRVWGLISTLSAKFAQNDIKIVDSLENFPSDDPKFLEEYMENRAWGPSVLIVNKSDIFPRNISLAAEGVNHINLMPVYSLNVYSMLKHETLILTPQAVEEIEDKLLYQLSRTDLKNVVFKHKPPEIVPNYPNLDPEVQP